ncbi:hypothetical protein KFE98_18035 [bacterium SCSIO 12741]|nr:hypothetical protein KFE98_18035 [bacterium SCSIO 12741]
MKLSKYLISVLFIGAILIPYQVSHGCGYYEEENLHFDFFRTEWLLPDNAYSDFNFSTELIRDYYSDTRDAINLEDWQNYMGADWNLDELREIIYQSSTPMVEQALSMMQSGSMMPPLNLTWTKLLETRDEAFLHYLLYAKQCEPHAEEYDPWMGNNRDLDIMDRLGEKGREAYQKTDNTFLKKRYAYQVIRLNHYRLDYENCIKAFDELIGDDAEQDLMYFWSLSLKAGAYRRLENDVKASYYFSRVFTSQTGRQVQAQRDYHIETQESWEQCLALCQNNKERADLWFMRGLGFYDKGLPSAQAIWKYNRNEDQMLHLLGRDLNRVEEQVLATETVEEYDYFSWANKEYLKEALQFIESDVLPWNPVHEAEWLYAAGYIHFLLGQEEGAQKHLSMAKDKYESMEGSGQVLAQIKVLNTLLKYRVLEKGEKVPEEVLVSDLHTLSSRSGDYYIEQGYEYLLVYLNRIYHTKDGDPVKQALVRAVYPYSHFSMNHNPGPWPLDGLIDFLQLEKYGPLDEFLVDHFSYTLSDLYLLKARVHVVDGNLDSAQYYLHQMEKGGTESVDDRGLMANPFGFVVNDCHDCEYERYRGLASNLETVVDSMVYLQKQVNDSTLSVDVRAESAMTLANTFYNLTFYGNAWYMVYEDFYSGYYYWNDYGDQEPWSDDGGGELYFAQEYYEKALDLASQMKKGKKKDELQATLYYLYAKCEQGDYFFGETPSTDGEDEFYENYKNNRQGFESLLGKYQHTEFYARVIEECGYLQTYRDLYYEK